MKHGAKFGLAVYKLTIQTGIGAAIVLLIGAASARAESVCDRGPERFAEVTADPGMRFAFDNAGGLFGGGVCWWHSRFQRAVWSLAEFEPSLPKPTRAQARTIIRRLARFTRVEKIGGYADFRAFSADFRDLIQNELNAWQIRDGFVRQQWIRGLRGRANYDREPARLTARMRAIAKSFAASRLLGEAPWLMLQMRGITSHAALLVDLIDEGAGAMRLKVVDSNYPDEVKELVFRPGMGSVENVYDRDVVPYLGFSNDLVKIRAARRRECAGSRAGVSPAARFSEGRISSPASSG